MRELIHLFLLLIILGCNQKQASSNIKFDETEIDRAELKLNIDDPIAVKLSNNQVNQIRNVVDFNGILEIRKAKPKFWLVIKTNKNSVLRYKIMDTYFGEKDLYAKLIQKNYFNNIYSSEPKVISQIQLEH